MLWSMLCQYTLSIGVGGIEVLELQLGGMRTGWDRRMEEARMGEERI